MFTGITQEIGNVKEVKKTREIIHATVSSKTVPAKSEIGSSVLVDGICSTVVKKGKGWFSVDYMNETLKKTNVKEWKRGRRVNLESSLRVGDEIAGHFVYGHIDYVGVVQKAGNRGADIIITITIPKKFYKFVVEKGSVAVNGVSLTVIQKKTSSFAAALIPHTLKHTNLGGLAKGDRVNIEVDVIGKYINSSKRKVQNSKS